VVVDGATTVVVEPGATVDVVDEEELVVLESPDDTPTGTTKLPTNTTRTTPTAAMRRCGEVR
jgi:hypothetical protein